MGDANETERRAAALDALKTASPRETQTFWQQHGTKIAGAVALLLGLWLVTRAVGSFLRTSVEETTRSQEELRRGMRR